MCWLVGVGDNKGNKGDARGDVRGGRRAERAHTLHLIFLFCRKLCARIVSVVAVVAGERGERTSSIIVVMGHGTAALRDNTRENILNVQLLL